MSDKTYNFIRFLAEIAISAIGALYSNLAEIWGLPYGEAVAKSCLVIAAFLGIFTEWQRRKYNSTLNMEQENEDNGV